MVPDAKSLAYLFSECMIHNDNVFCAEDFYKLMLSHRINIEELNFDDIVKNTLFSFNQNTGKITTIYKPNNITNILISV